MAYTKEQRIINSVVGSTKKQREENSKDLNKQSFNMPNNSGDHQRSIKRNDPVNDYDLVNKKFNDDNFLNLDGNNSMRATFKVDTNNVYDLGTSAKGIKDAWIRGKATIARVYSNTFGNLGATNNLAIWDSTNTEWDISETFNFNGENLIGVGTADFNNIEVGSTGQLEINNLGQINLLTTPSGANQNLFNITSYGMNSSLGEVKGLGAIIRNVANGASAYQQAFGFNALFQQSHYAGNQFNDAGGALFRAQSLHTAGVTKTLIGGSFRADPSSNLATTQAFAGQFGIYGTNAKTGASTHLATLKCSADFEDLAVTNGYGAWIDTFTLDAGSCTNMYGLKIEDQDLATNNWAIKTGSGDVELGDDTYWVGAGSGLPFAEIYVYNNSTADTVASGSFVQMTRFDTDGQSNNCTPDHTNDHITITKAGIYKINFNASFSGSGSVTWYGGVFKNNGATQLTNIQVHRKLGAAGDVGSVAASGYADLAVNDTIELWFRQDSGVNKDITIVDCQLNVLQVGGT